MVYVQEFPGGAAQLCPIGALPPPVAVQTGPDAMQQTGNAAGPGALPPALPIAEAIALIGANARGPAPPRPVLPETAPMPRRRAIRRR